MDEFLAMAEKVRDGLLSDTQRVDAASQLSRFSSDAAIRGLVVLCSDEDLPKDVIRGVARSLAIAAFARGPAYVIEFQNSQLSDFTAEAFLALDAELSFLTVNN